MTADTGTGTEFDAALTLDRITVATGHLLRTASTLSDAEVRAPSLLPDWSRAHVLTHLARNADGGSRLLSWARTGVEAAEYPSLEARAEEIEAGAGRGAADLVADLSDSAARFADEYRRMPTAAWARTVRWTRGQEHPAARAADSRLSEVLVHHADLDAGYTPAQWPTEFVHAMLIRTVASFAARGDTPAMHLLATDTGSSHRIGTGQQAPFISGTQSALLAWLMGRSRGDGLSLRNAAALPQPPFLY